MRRPCSVAALHMKADCKVFAGVQFTFSSFALNIMNTNMKCVCFRTGAFVQLARKKHWIFSFTMLWKKRRNI